MALRTFLSGSFRRVDCGVGMTALNFLGAAFAAGHFTVFSSRTAELRFGSRRWVQRKGSSGHGEAINACPAG